MTNGDTEFQADSYTKNNVDKMRELMTYIGNQSVIYALDFGANPFKGRVQADKDVVGIELERLLSLLHARINIWLISKKDPELAAIKLKEFREWIALV
jgi:hypothetical protein